MQAASVATESIAQESVSPTMGPTEQREGKGKAWRYGLEKLYAEEMAKVYGKDFPMETRIARSAPTQGLCYASMSRRGCGCMRTIVCQWLG